jgi:protein-disulfide isomerase
MATFLFYPTHSEAEFLLPYDYAVSIVSPRLYSDWVDALYTSASMPNNENEVIQLIEDLGISIDDVMKVVTDSNTSIQIQKRLYEIDKTGIYGTPVVFVNGKPVVGPKPLRVYRMMLTGSWF